jgi:hypothetical protein
MIVDIEKIAEDEKTVCYKSVCGDQPTNLFLVTKADLSVSPIVMGDSQSMAGALAKLRRSVKTGDFPAVLTLATG